MKDNDVDAASKSNKQLNRPARLIMWVLGLVALYLACTGLVLPQVLRLVLEQRLSQALNSPGRVESLTLNPFTLKLTASNVAVPYPGDAGIFLHLERLELTPSFSSLLRLAPGIKELKLESPVVDLTRFPNGSFSPQLFFEGQEADATETATSADEERSVFPCIIYNFSINNGTLTFRDQIKNTTLVAENITLTVPFASTLPEDQDLPVTPRLSATVNGRPLVCAGETRPFSNSLRTEFTLNAEELDLGKFREYIAPYTPLELKSGALFTSLKLQLSRKEGERIHVVLAGKAEIADLELVGPQGTALKVARAGVDLESVPLGAQRIAINEVFLDAPAVTLRRAADGTVDWQHFFTRPEPAAPPAKKKNTTPRQALIVTKARIADGVATWHDATAPGFAPHTIRNIRTTLSNMRFEATGQTDFSLEFGEGPAQFAATGKASLTPLRVEASVHMDRMPLAPFAAYLSQATGLSLNGALGLKGDCVVEYGERTSIRLGEITLRDVSAIPPESRTPLLTAKTLAVNDITANLSARSLTVGRLSASGVNAFPVRGKDGNFVLPVPAKQGVAPKTAWQATIGNVQLDATGITLTDHSLRAGAVLPFSDVKIAASSLSTQPGRQWTANISAKPGKHGALRLEARGAFEPLALSFRIRADKADITSLSPYLREVADLSLSEGVLNADVSGNLAPGSRRMRFNANGDAGLHGVSLTAGDKEVLGWGRLRAEKFRYRNTPGRAGALSVENLILNGPRVSLVIGEDGRNSIQRVLRQSPPKTPPKTPEAPQGAPVAQEQPAKPASPFSALSFGGFRLTNGEIMLRNEGLQPPHFLRVESLRMEMGKLSSDPASRGEFEGSFRLRGSPIAVDGWINPLIAPFAAELTIDISDLDLTAFSQHAAKFTGYPIRRGDLSARTTLALNGLQVNGRSELVISKLDLGDKDPSSDAPDMPIKAAIGLLRDLSGDISLSLPVSGRMDDPQFRVGGVLSKAVANTMLKAVTTPVRMVGGFFSLFASTPRQERIHFASGEDRIRSRASASLRSLIEELPKRQRAKLELIGAADMLEKADITTAGIMKKLRELKYASLPEAEREATTPQRVRVGLHVDAEEYARLLREVYVAWPEKLAGDVPKTAREMMRALRGSVSVTDEQVSELAEARAKAVRDELIRIDASLDHRITIGPSKITSESSGGRRLDAYVLINIR